MIAHNGIFPNEVQPGKGELRCDTRIVAEDKFRGDDLSNPGLRQFYADWMGAGNKVVILTVNPDYGESAYIINEKSGHWEPDGIWYSNWDHLGYTVSRWVPKTPPPPTYWSDRYGDMLCPECWKRSRNRLARVHLCALQLLPRLRGRPGRLPVLAGVGLRNQEAQRQRQLDQRGSGFTAADLDDEDTLSEEAQREAVQRALQRDSDAEWASNYFRSGEYPGNEQLINSAGEPDTEVRPSLL